MNPEDPRDEHLLAALRHAPDRDVAPPAQLSAAILGQAQQAVRVLPPRASQRWRALWARLWQPAPMAAFGTLAMATLIGVMWRGQDLPEAAPGLRPEIVVLAPAPAPAPARPELHSPTVLSQSKEGPAAEAAPAMPTAPIEPAVRAKRDAPRDAPRSKELGPSTSAERTDRRFSLQTSPEPAQRGAANTARAASDDSAAAPVASAQQAPAAAATPPRAAEGRRDALAKSSLADAAAAAAAAPAVARARSEMPAGALGAALPAASPLAQASAEIDAVSGVRWRVRPERLVAHDSAQRAWWLALNRATQGRWQLVATALAAPADDLILLIDGQARGSLSFAPQAVLWRDASGLVWRAPVAAETLREWQEAIGRW